MGLCRSRPARRRRTICDTWFPVDPSDRKGGNMVIVAGTIRLDPAKRADLEAAFDRMRDATLQEKGCLEYQAYRDRKDSGVVLIFEKWESDEALGAHFATPHMA